MICPGVGCPCGRVDFTSKAEITLQFLWATWFDFEAGPATSEGLQKDVQRPLPTYPSLWLHTDTDVSADSPCQHAGTTAQKGRCAVLCPSSMMAPSKGSCRVLQYCKQRDIPILEAGFPDTNHLFCHLHSLCGRLCPPSTDPEPKQLWTHPLSLLLWALDRPCPHFPL